MRKASNKEELEAYWKYSLGEKTAFVIFYARVAYGLLAYDLRPSARSLTEEGIENVLSLFNELLEENADNEQVNEVEWDVGDDRGYIPVMCDQAEAMGLYLTQILQDDLFLKECEGESVEQTTDFMKEWPKTSGI